MQFRRVQTRDLEPGKGGGGENQQLNLRQHVGAVKGRVVHCEGQQVIEQPRVTTDEDTQDCGNAHCGQHVEWRFTGADAGIVGKEGKKRNLDTGMVKDTGRGKQQRQPDQRVTLLQRRYHHHGLADETAEKRKCRDRGRPNDTQGGGDRHALIQAAKVGAVDAPSHVQHRAHGHHQQALENHVVEGVRDRAVHSQRRTQANAYDHKTDLVDHAVSQHPPQVVLYDGEKNGKAGHDGADVYQRLGAGKTAGQRVDGDLGREGAQKHRAGGGGLGVCVSQPVVQ